MVDRVSALARCYRVGRFGTPGKCQVSVRLRPALQLQQLAAWPDTVPAVERLTCEKIAVDDPPVCGRSAIGERGALLRIQPLKWWLLGDSLAIPDGEIGHSLDLSHAFVQLQVSGVESMTLLNRFLPLDLRPSRTPVGSVMSTAMHHVGVTVWSTDSGFELFIPRSFAQSLYELLCAGAEQFGLEVLPASADSALEEK